MPKSVAIAIQEVAMTTVAEIKAVGIATTTPIALGTTPTTAVDIRDRTAMVPPTEGRTTTVGERTTAVAIETPIARARNGHAVGLTTTEATTTARTMPGRTAVAFAHQIVNR